MEPNEKEMLKKTLELSQDNNKMLKAIRRSMFWGRVTKIIYWVVIIGAAVGVYYYIEPYLNDAVGIYGNFKNSFQNFGGLLK